jgi:hypothetical protein
LACFCYYWVKVAFFGVSVLLSLVVHFNFLGKLLHFEKPSFVLCLEEERVLEKENCLKGKKTKKTNYILSLCKRVCCSFSIVKILIITKTFNVPNRPFFKTEFRKKEVEKSLDQRSKIVNLLLLFLV